MSTPPLALANIVDISVTVSAAAVAANGLNVGLYIGNSAVIPSYGANSRVRAYSAATFSTAMQTDGFTINDPEYIAAQIYFSQTPQAPFIKIGRQDGTAIGTLTLNVGGTGWKVGDQFTVTQSGGSNSLYQVLTVATGVVVTFEAVQQGTGFTVATDLPTAAVSPSTGTGLTVNITAIGESLLQAAQACRNADGGWYGLAVYNPVDADNLALSQWADPLWQNTRYYPWSNDVAIPNNVSGNLAAQLQATKLRVLGIYSTTQSGLFPNNIFAAAGLMGVEMGRMTGLAGSFFSTAHKQIVGIAPEPLTQTQYNNILSLKWNAYCNFNPYQFFEPGFMSSGDPSYLWLFIALYVQNVQINCMNTLQALAVVPQTNQGEHVLLDDVNQAGQLLNGIGFLFDGIWEGVTIEITGVTLTDGQAIPGGYLNQAQPYSQQSSGDRAAGKAMPIYSAITTAGAVQSLLIGVYAQL